MCVSTGSFATLVYGAIIMIRDRALRSLIVVGLVLLDAVLLLTLISWLIMGVGMSGGMMNGGSPSWGMMAGTGVVALLVLAGVIAALVWAMPAPADTEGPREPIGAAATGRDDVR
jgi:hypothetical protein